MKPEQLYPALFAVCCSFVTAQDYDFGDLPDSPYPTKLPSGARHIVTQNLYIGTVAPDIEADGAALASAQGDDGSGVDDEDGIDPATLRITAGVRYNFRVKATNTFVGNAWLHGFVDWNQDGDFLDPDEYSNVQVPGGSLAQTFMLTFDVPPTAITGAQTAMRLRLATASVLTAFGPAQNGEVEDFLIPVHPPGELKDFGDLPDLGPGTSPGVFFTGSPPNYKTFASDGGPSHGIVPGLNFSNNTGSPDSPVDAEPDGLASPFADGDNVDRDNDELGFSLSTSEAAFIPDGVTSHFLLSQILTLPITSATGNQARVALFIDLNSDGDFDDIGEGDMQLSYPGDGSATIAVFSPTSKIEGIHPATNFTREFAMRCRITTDESVGPDGAATDGEVIDFVQTYQFSVPQNGYDPLDLGDLPAPYPTLRADNGARHVITPDIFLGNLAPDGENDGAPSSAADGDDLAASDDENAINAATIGAVAGSPIVMPVKVTNLPKDPATLCGFVDWNGDGDFLDTGETSSMPVPDAVNGVIINLPWDVPPDALTTAPVAVRLRLVAGESPLPPDGWANSGEVEDFLVTVTLEDIDYGDLPAPYASLLAADGARHAVVAGLFIGTTAPDLETNATTDTSATGDDTTADDDEDGITLAASTAYAGVPFHFRVLATNNTAFDGRMKAFIDWNHDGDFDDAEETVMVTVPFHVGVGSGYVFHFSVPVDAVTTSPTAVRLRLTTDNFIGPIGRANDGEVEDCFITVSPPAFDWGDLPDIAAGTATGIWGTASPPDYRTLSADNGPSHVIVPGLGFTNPSGGLLVDAEADGQPTNDATGDDNQGVEDEPLTLFRFGSLIPHFDGPRTTFSIFSEQFVEVENLTGTPAWVHWFDDSNNDGDFGGPGELNAHELATTDGEPPRLLFAHDIPYQTPGSNYTHSFGFRIRLSSLETLGPYGPAPDGEVVDQLGSFIVPIPDFPLTQDWGDLPAPYGTLLADNGARHGMSSSLFLGTAATDAETDGQPSPTADGDDLNGTGDEDSLNASLVDVHAGFSLKLAVQATNTSGGLAYLHAFADWNADGVFNTADETAIVTVPAGSLDQTFDPHFHVPLNATTTQPIAVRLRLTSALELGPMGPAPDGEVEDYFIAPAKKIIDYGDLPDASGDTAETANGTAPGVVTNLSTISQGDYRTKKYDLGPHHIGRQDLNLCLESLRPETQVDGEDDAHPTADADGDDNDIPPPPNGGVSPAPIGENDEAGMMPQLVKQVFNPATFEFTQVLYVSVAIRNETGQPAFLKAFIDSNNDGDFDDGDESSITIMPSPLAIAGIGPDYTIDRPDAYPGEFIRTPLASIPPTAPGVLPPAYGIVFIIKNQLPLTDTGIRGFTKKLPIRLRLSTTPDLGPNNTSLIEPIPDGEVEDHIITYPTSFDNPYTNEDWGDLPAPYPTTLASDGPWHAVSQVLYLGNMPPDTEGDGLASSAADGDDSEDIDDEDSITAASVIAVPGLSFNLPVTATNVLEIAATLYGFIDWNGDGDFLDEGETSTQPVPSATFGGTIVLPWAVPLTAVTTAPVAVRLRLSTAVALPATGSAPDGEVEDFFITVMAQGIDFGDLPDSVSGTAAGVVTDLSTVSQGDYQTLLSDNGARHIIRPDLVLFNDFDPTGIHIDPETDGHPGPACDGDDTDGDDDEEQVLCAVVAQKFMPSSPYDGTGKLQVVWVAGIVAKNKTGVPAVIHSFADANNDGDFNDIGEKGILDLNHDGDALDVGESSVVDVPSGPGTVVRNIVFSRTFDLTATNYIPTWTMKIPMRFRLSTATTLGPEGPAPDGEVEDYLLSIQVSIGDWRPRLSTGLPDWDRFIDTNGPATLISYDLAPPNFISSQNIQWRIGDTPFQGNFLFLNPSQLQALGTGVIPYSISTEFYPLHLGAHLGFLRLGDLDDFRSFMTQYSLTDDTSQPDEDPDGDGSSNFVEFAFGTNPGVPSLLPGMIPRVVDGGEGESFFTGAYLRRAGGTATGGIYVSPDVTYTAEGSNNLLDWTKPVTGALPFSGLPPAPADYEWGAVRLIAPVSDDSKGFLRIHVGPP